MRDGQLTSMTVGFAGRVVGISLAGSVFGNMLQVYLGKYAPSLPPQYLEAVINSPAAVWDTVPEVSHEYELTGILLGQC